MLSLTLTLGAKNRGKENNLKERIENRKKMRKELSLLFATLILQAFLSYFVIAYKIYIRMQMRGILVEEQI